MCPVCAASAVVVFASTTSAGGITALALKLRGKGKVKKSSSESETKEK